MRECVRMDPSATGLALVIFVLLIFVNAFFVAAAAPHRDAAFVAARAAIDELKRVVPIWKKEYTDDGAVWIEDHA